MKAMQNVWVVTLAVVTLAAWNVRAEEPPKEFTWTLECRSASSNATKYGHAELINSPCTEFIPRQYLILTKSITATNESRVRCLETDPWIENPSWGYSMMITQTCSRVTNCMVETGSGSQTTTSSSSSCSSTYVAAGDSCEGGAGYWTNIVDGCGIQEPGWESGASGAYETSVRRYSYTNNVVSNPLNYSHYESTYDVQLSEENTTAEVVALAKTNAESILPVEWTPAGQKSPKAEVIIGGGELSATYSVVQARFKVWCPTNQEFEINYVRHDTFYSNCVPHTISTNMVIKGKGTGQTQYFEVDMSVPPSACTTNDCVLTKDSSRWIEVPCAPSVSCSSGSCSETAGSVRAGLGSVRVSMGLGASLDGGSGSLFLWGAEPDPKLTMPEGLETFGDLTGSEILRTTGGVLRQILAPLCLADIVTNSGTSYTVNFYYTASQSWQKGVDGFYDTSGGTSFSSCTVEQVGSTNHIRVTSQGDVYDYTWSAADRAWTLSSGGGIRKETKTWDDVAMVSTNTIRNASDEVVYQEVRYYTNLASSGQVITKRVVGTGAAAQTSQWFYYDNAVADGTNYGKVKLELEPSGFWRRYEFDTNGLVTQEVSQFLNAATNAAESLCRVVEYNRDLLTTNAFSTETRVEKLLGQEIGRQYTVVFPGETWDIQCQNAGVAWDNASNLVTVTKISTMEGFEGLPASVLRWDGTMDIYQYETNWDGSEKTVTMWSGEPDGSGTNIVNGTKTVTVTGSVGEMLTRTVYDLTPGQSEVEISNEQYSSYDDLKRSYTLTRNYQWPPEEVQYGCCGLERTRGRDGLDTFYYTDALKRQVASVRAGITTSNVLDAAGNLLATIRVGTNGSAIILRQAAYDTAGRAVTETNALNGVTDYAETKNGSGETVRTTTYPDNGTRIETYYQDGSLKSVTGTAAHPVRYEYGVVSEGGIQRAYTKEIKLNTNGTDTAEWTISYTDMLGRNYKTVYAAASGSPASQSYFNNLGRLWKQVDPDGVATLYAYNGKGELEYTCIDSNRNGTIDFSGADRITRTVNVVTNYLDFLAYSAARGTLTYQWAESGPLLVGERWTSLDGLRTATIAIGRTNRTEISYWGNGVYETTVTAPDGSFTVNHFEEGRQTSTIQYDPSWTTLRQTAIGYDEHGRQSWVAVLQPDYSYATNTFGYNAADLVATNTTPSPDGVQPGQVTTTFYDTSLRAWRMVQPDNTSVTNEYFASGQLKKTYGSRTYPVEYTYDYAGRMKTMKTWQDFASGTGAATTTWNYDQYRGWLESKRYHDNTGPDYSYSAAGRLDTRIWARGDLTVYDYNDAGDLAAAYYSDSTPSVAYGYDRRGRQTTITQAGGTTISRAYNDAGQVLAESYSGGPLNGLTVTNTYDALLRRTNVSVRTTGTIYEAGYGYDNASRLETVTSGVNSASYSYLANSPLVENITFQNNGTTRMITTKGHDLLNRLTNSTSSVFTNSQFEPVTSFAYGYSQANQRTNVTTVDESNWVYQYDDLGQVVSGKKYWSDGSPVKGQQFDYAFDDIGNRESATRDGRQSTYTPNLLNQYTSRTVPGYVNVLGEATNDATVTVWTQEGGFPTDRHDEYFRAEVTASNSLAPVWLNITNIAVLNQGTNVDLIATNAGNWFVSKTPETFQYDADGNLTNDGRWMLTWDGENRLVKMESYAGAPVGSKLRLEFAYDGQGRRIQKVVSTNNGSVYVGQSTNRFVYDGWNLLTVFNHQMSAIQFFYWGLDLSGTMQGAGGVGGLLWVRFGPAPQFAAYDGNGNVAVLIHGGVSGAGNVTAQYEYGPFGELLRATGTWAKSNPFRFSTKYQDNETDLLYYGYRYYDPARGNWPNRDPIGERGGMNLYGNCGNDVINCVDWLGLWKIERKGQARAMAYAEEGDTIRKLAGIIRLNTSEWKKWLKPEEVYTKPYGLDTVLTSCDSFSVPNTAYVNYNVGFVDFRLAHFMLTYTGYLRDRWSDAGYKVRYYRLLLGADVIKSQLNDPDIYTFAYIGHGAVGNLILGNDESEWVKPGRYTPFGIDEMLLIACDSDYGWQTWKSNVSGRGILTTVEGDLSISNMRFKTHRGEGQ